MKRLLQAALVAMLSLSAPAVVKTYVWATNTWNGLPSVDLGRVRFPDGTWDESARGVGEPEYHAALDVWNTSESTGQPTTKYSYQDIVFCNGRAVQIEACPTNTEHMSRMSWSQYTKTASRHFIDIPNGCTIFGGGNGTIPYGGSRGDATDANFMNTSVTMFGGSAKAIYGGSLGFGAVATATITVAPGGQVTGNIYGGGEGRGGGGFYESVHKDDVRRNFVGHTTIRVTRATNDLALAAVYGGGHSVCDVSVADIILEGGDVTEICAGSSSGMVGTTRVSVRGGRVVRDLYAWSRGYTGFAQLDIEGGSVSNIILGGQIPKQDGTKYDDATGGWCSLNLKGGTVGSVIRGRDTPAGTTAGPSGPWNTKISGTYVKGVVQSPSFDPSEFNLVKAVSGIDESILLGPEEEDRVITGAGFAQYEYLRPQSVEIANGYLAAGGEDYRITTNTPVLTVDSIMIARQGFAKIVSTNGSLQAALDSKASTNTVLPYILLKDSGNGNVYRIGIQNGALTPVQQ